MLLFGGHANVYPQRSEGRFYTDTWAYDYKADTWTEMKPTVFPSGSAVRFMAFDPVNNVTINVTGDVARKQTWVYRNKNKKPVSVLIETEKGDIELELYPSKAPGTVANFLRYVDARFYDGGRFHRTVRLDNQPGDKVKIEVVQAGGPPERVKDEFPPIRLERTRDTGLRHTDGAISMARDGPDTATADFFLCIGDQADLDFGGKRNPDGQGFAAFGKVVRGMDVVRKIQAAPAEGQGLKPPVKILTARRKSR
jgi:peptidyl-prolyl cis-trans isomerase A (cyclophilin A)